MRWISLVVAAALSGCVSADGGALRGERAAMFAQGQCFRASDVTNYNIEPPHAAFVLTRRGYVYGLISENCYRDDEGTISLARSRRADLWLCAGDATAVFYSEWRKQDTQCLAKITAPIRDPDLSGFRARAG